MAAYELLGGRATQSKRQSAQHEAARRLFCVRSRHVTQCHAMSRRVTPCHAVSRPCHTVSRRVTPCHDHVTPCHARVTTCHTHFKTSLANTTTLSRNIRHNICAEATPHDHNVARPRARRPLCRHQCGRFGTVAAQPTCACVAVRSFRLRNDWSDRGARCCAIRVETKTRSNDHHHVRIEPLRFCEAVGLIVWFAAGAHDQSECHIANACCLCCVLESMYDLAVVA